MKRQSKLLPILIVFWGFSLAIMLASPTAISVADSDGSDAIIGISNNGQPAAVVSDGALADVPVKASGIADKPRDGIATSPLLAGSLMAVLFPMLCVGAIFLLSLFIVVLASPVGHYQRGNKPTLIADKLYTPVNQLRAWMASFFWHTGAHSRFSRRA